MNEASNQANQFANAATTNYNKVIDNSINDFNNTISNKLQLDKINKMTDIINGTASDSLKSIGNINPQKQVKNTIEQMNPFSKILKSVLTAVPDRTWKIVSDSTLEKICNVVREAPDSEGLPVKLEMIKKVNELLGKMIEQIDINNFKKEIEREIINKLNEPFNVMFDKEYVIIETMKSILTVHYDAIKKYLEIYLNSEFIKEKQDKKNIYDYINAEDMKKYIENVDNNIQESPVQESPVQESPVQESPENTNRIEDQKNINRIEDQKNINRIEDQENTNRIEDQENTNRIEDQKNINRIEGGNQEGGSVDNIAQMAGSMLKIYDEIIETMIIQNLQKQSDNANDPNTDKPRFVDQLHSRIITSAAYHLEKPEGRQMYLRKLEPVLQQSIESLTAMESVILPLFIQCIGSPIIQTEIAKVKENKQLNEFIKKLTDNINALSEAKNPVEKIYKDLQQANVDNSTIENKRIEDKKGGNLRKSRNRKYLPKKRKQTKKRQS